MNSCGLGPMLSFEMTVFFFFLTLNAHEGGDVLLIIFSKGEF